MGAGDADVGLSVRRVDAILPIDWDADESPIIDLGNIDPETLPRGVMSPGPAN
ncbi:hypothetical protein [Rhizobium tubonense]|uniref:hypothetical protein n=1 Tax=Rhizobium tubonense TaxID=484088 RepID=UPI0012B693EF|nr:hypothetical protein [Rhizobium tubonense]